MPTIVPRTGPARFKACRRCFRSVVECEVCKGEGKVWGMFGDCTECDGTGSRCPDHGKHWT